MSDSRVLQFEVEQAGEVLLERLARGTEFSKRALKDILGKGAVWLTRDKGTRRVRRAKAPLRVGDVLHLYYDPQVLASEPPPALLIADEGAYSVWFKPSGMFSQGSKWGDHCTIGRWSERHLRPERPAHTVHRLDRATSGLILIAHKKKTARALSALFASREVEKTYQAVVCGQFPARLTLEEPVDGRAARSHATTLDYDPQADRSLLEVRIETGRKHQIRRHLSGAGFPIVGDRLHGRAQPDDPDLMLCAVQLAFPSPDSGVDVVYQVAPELRPTLT